MLAIVEAALTRDLLDVFEQALERLFALPQLGFAQPRRVDDHPAPGKLDELAVASHVAAFSGAMHRAGLHHLSARHTVDERRLARARRAEEDPGACGPQLLCQSVDSLARDRAGDH